MLFPVSCFTREGVKFWSKVEIKETCWVWHGARNNGYGVARRAGATAGAHRVSYEAMVGPVPKGLDLDHLCRNRACVRPDHLEPVTRRVNLARGLGTGWGTREACGRGHAYTEENTRWRLRGGKWSRVCRLCRRLSAMSVRDRKAA